MRHYEPLYRFPDTYDVRAELMLGMREDGSPCPFFADDVWLRGKLDVVLIPEARGDMAFIIDHKTGKPREDPDELRLHALLLKASLPQLDTIKGWYNWLATCEMGRVHDLSDTVSAFDVVRARHNVIRSSYELGEDAFAPKQNPLCPWCPVKACEFHP
jgi:hypothetical protein